MEHELVSIIVPTYNRSKTISNTIHSIINQSYKNWELIIVDDHSTDDTNSILESFSISDSRIKTIKNTNRKGPAGARNSGLEHAKGKYIAFLDSDDEWLDIHLSESIDALKKMKVGICFSLWYEKRSTEVVNVLNTNNLSKKIDSAIEALNAHVMEHLVLFEKNFFEHTMTYGVYCYHINTLVLKREVLMRNGKFNENLEACEDSDFVFRLLLNNEFCLIRNVHFIYNQGEDNIYNFMDRSSIDMEALLYDTTAVKKLNMCGLNKCKMFKSILSTIKKLPDDRKRIIELCNAHIAYKYASLAYLNTRLFKYKSAYFMIMSCIYKFEKNKFYYMLKILFSLDRKKIYIEPQNINIW